MSIRPLPVVDERSSAYWAGAAAGRLVLARCRRCGLLNHPPGIGCSRCFEPDATFEPVDVTGGGVIRARVLLRQAFLPGFDPPYLLVDVALDEDAEIRLIGRLLDGPDVPAPVGARVRLAFERLGDDIAVPGFELERP